MLWASLNNAVREELISRNVAALIRVPKPRRRKVKPWSADEVRAFLESARKSGDPLYAAYVLILVLGLRRGEVLGLRWEDTVDGLIYASSMVMLDSARRETPVPALARWLLSLGIAATLAANVAHGPWSSTATTSPAARPPPVQLSAQLAGDSPLTVPGVPSSHLTPPPDQPQPRT